LHPMCCRACRQSIADHYTSEGPIRRTREGGVNGSR
jgi:hypothetical protein